MEWKFCGDGRETERGWVEMEMKSAGMGRDGCNFCSCAGLYIKQWLNWLVITAITITRPLRMTWICNIYYKQVLTKSYVSDTNSFTANQD